MTYLTLFFLISAAILLLVIFGLVRHNQKIRAVQQQLEASYEEIRKLSLAVEQSPNSVIITDVDRNIVFVNNTFLKTTGYTTAEVIGKNPRIFRSGKTDIAMYRDMWATLQKGNTWRGEFVNVRKDGSEYTELVALSPIFDERRKLIGYLAIKQDITERKESEQRIHQLAFYDSLTGIPNRAQFMLRLWDLKENDRLGAIILINIDRFKVVNAVRGEYIGDMLLCALAKRVNAAIEHIENAHLSRIAADEFASLITFNSSISPQQAQQNIEHYTKVMYETCTAPFGLEIESVSVTVSIGIALFPDPSDLTPENILSRANIALHHAKKFGGNQCVFFASDMKDSYAENFWIEKELRSAIRNGQLSVYLQPKVHADGKMMSAEALVRWRHPERGMIAPSLFIPVAEQTDLIVTLSEWIFEEALQIISHCAASGSPLHLSINLSPRHFRQHYFVMWFKTLVGLSGVNPALITLEVTEGLFIDNLEETSAKMKEISTMGVGFSIDDFGTGYSSLAYLKQLPVRELKIDKIFIQDAPVDSDDAALVEAILAVADRLGLQVVAEGVETLEQVEFLAKRCASPILYQGYYFGKPEPAEVWEQEWLMQHRV
ncbi:putative bifunctional diguanylate cyclase/phosphodiesterase [Chrysiogenes arsenatis]|uniref:putative bifunctional diguanylate cyclase/phosphodiesterase n=1 Tax=Chrysiogenes arsenatis TaxID=309797 RepID=UPI000428EAB8|nr:GGDEF domain-containing phosphodiesterase [Chrysiogenes arsenatis]